MSTFLYGALGVIIFFAVITISVALHEAGHMFTAKGLNIPVPKYFVGFGPTLWSKKKNGTEYGIKAIPLGGFILVEDTTQPEKSPERGLLSYVAPWKRIAIFVAGPAVNLVLGVALLFGVLLASPEIRTSTTVGAVNSCSTAPTNCAAEKAGVKPGDKFVSLNGEKITSFESMKGTFSTQGNNLVVKRGNQEITLSMKANKDKYIGVVMAGEKVDRSPGQAAGVVKDLFVLNIKSLGKIPEQVPGLFKAVTGQEKRSTDSVSSVIGVGKVYSETTRTSNLNGDDKVRTIIMYSGLLNLGLGLLNLLPLLPLDGGRIFFAMIDSVKIRLDHLRHKTYRPTDYRWVEAMSIATGGVLGVFMLLALLADIVAPLPNSQ